MISLDHIHPNTAQVPFFIVHLFASRIHLRPLWKLVTTTNPREPTLSPLSPSLSRVKTAASMLIPVLNSTTREVSRLVPHMG